MMKPASSSNMTKGSAMLLMKKGEVKGMVPMIWTGSSGFASPG
jgi:hypothetical protein